MLVSNKNTYVERGNVVIFILIAVFLFGALAYSFSRSARDGTSNISRQQAKIAVQEFLNYARIVEGAVNRVRRNGCSENEINFTNPLITHPTYWGAYINSSSPLDKSCHIFEPEGGKISFVPPNAYFTDSSNQYYTFTPGLGIEGIGELNKSELMIYFRLSVSDESAKTLCKEMNILVGNEHSITGDPLNTAGADRFNGQDFNDALTGGNTLNHPHLIGKPTGCGFTASHGQFYIFYHVLIAR